MSNFLIEGPGGVSQIKLQGGYNSALPITTTGLVTAGSLAVTGGITFDAALITSNSATAFVVGPNGLTNPVFKVDASVASAATGISVQGQAAAGGVIVAVLSSGTNESFFIRPKGSGGFRVQGASTVALQVAPVSGGGPNFVVNNNAATSATGVQIISQAAGGGVAVSTISTGTDESMTFSAKGAGTLTLNSGVVATAGGASNDGVMYGSISVGLFTGTGAPTFSAMNGSIYTDSNATTTTTRIYVNKSGAGTAGTTWTALTTAA